MGASLAFFHNDLGWMVINHVLKTLSIINLTIKLLQEQNPRMKFKLCILLREKMLKCSMVSMDNHIRVNQVGLEFFKTKDNCQKFFFSYSIVHLGII